MGSRRDWYAVICDKFDVDHFRAVVEQSDRLQKLRARGLKEGPTFGPLLQDVYNILYKPEPRPNPNMASEFEVNRTVIEELQNIPDYETLHRMTRLDVFSSAIGTISLGESAIEVLKKMQKRLKQAQEQLKQAQEQAQRNPDDSNAQEQLEKAQQQMQKQRDRLRQQLRKAVQNTKKEVDDAQAASRMWGMDDAPASETSLGDRLRLAETLLNNPHLRRIAEVLGRIEIISQQVQRDRYRFDASEVTSVKLGKTLEHLLPGELVKLRHPLLKKDWKRRFVEGQLMEYQLEQKVPLGRGPIVACVDESGSMMGPRDEWAKAVVIALAKIAQRQQRDFVFIPFSMSHEVMEYKGGKIDVMKIATHMYGSGTSFAGALRAALEVLERSEYERGDLIFITDGQAEITSSFAAALREKKEKLGFHAVGVLIGNDTQWTPNMEALFDGYAYAHPDKADDRQALELVFSV